MTSSPPVAFGFERTLFEPPLFLEGRDQVTAASELRTDSDAGTRARIAATLGRSLGYQGVWHGPPYTAWLSADGTIFLSMLPGETRPQQVLTVEMRPGRNRITLVASWTSREQVWSPPTSAEYRSSLSGLLADRRGIPLVREATLKVLSDRGAQFAFPVAPAAGQPETLCGWVREEPDKTELSGWDRDPMLVDPTLDRTYVLRHGPTRAAVFPYRIQGSWPDEALHGLRDHLNVLLPGRHVLRQLDHGCARVTVFLGVMDPIDPRRVVSPREWNRAGDRSCPAILDLYAAILARMVGVERGITLPSPRAESAVPQPDDRARSAFLRAEKAMGRQELVSAGGGFEEVGRIGGFSIPTRHFHYADIQSNDQLIRYVTTREQALVQ